MLAGVNRSEERRGAWGVGFSNGGGGKRSSLLPGSRARHPEKNAIEKRTGRVGRGVFLIGERGLGLAAGEGAV